MKQSLLQQLAPLQARVRSQWRDSPAQHLWQAWLDELQALLPAGVRARLMPQVRERLIDYISRCGILHALDMATEAKCDFLDAFERIVLAPRRLSYRVMFTGPTGTNAVEAALKLARKVTGRETVVAAPLTTARPLLRHPGRTRFGAQ